MPRAARVQRSIGMDTLYEHVVATIRLLTDEDGMAASDVDDDNDGDT